MRSKSAFGTVDNTILLKKNPMCVLYVWEYPFFVLLSGAVSTLKRRVKREYTLVRRSGNTSQGSHNAPSQQPG
jgi:hypothetical protein